MDWKTEIRDRAAVGRIKEWNKKEQIEQQKRAIRAAQQTASYLCHFI